MSKVISPILFISALILSAVYFLNSDINPNVVSYDHLTMNVVRSNGGVRGEFTAPYNYLGLLTLSFDNKEIIEKKSIFRIKERDSIDWHHVSNIDTIQYNMRPLYTFGLPTIVDSKNKIHQFEISIRDYIHGDPTLELNKQSSTIISHYLFPKSVLISDKDILLEFLLRKISYQLKNPYAPRIFFAYLLPLIGYWLYLAILHKYMKITLHVKPILFITLLGVGVDIFILRNNFDVLALVLGFMWIAGVLFHNIKPQTSILIALILLVWCPFFLIARMEWVGEKAANWMFIFMTIGFFQYLFKSLTHHEA